MADGGRSLTREQAEPGGPLQLTVVRGGGLAGLVTVTSLDAADLTDAEAARLRAAVEAAALFGLPPHAAPRPAQPAQPDRFGYEVTVRDRGREHTVRLSEPLPPGLDVLLAWTRHARATTRVGPAGRPPAR